MESRSKEESEGTDNQKLHQQYKSLQEEWSSIKLKQSKPETLTRSSTDSKVLMKTLDLLDNSPRLLMSSLQHRRSPSGAWKVRNNDLAAQDILRERRAAIESGELKGRKKLFDSAETAAEVDFDGWDGSVQESEVRSTVSYDSDDEKENVESKEELFPVYGAGISCSPKSSLSSSSSTSSYICDECMEKEMVAVEKERVVVAKEDEEEEKRSVNGVKGWIAIGLAACAFGIISVWRFCGYGDSNEMILVPT